MRRASHIDMCNGPLFQNVIAYTIPIILTSILQLLFNAADLVVVGQFCGSNSVAAVGATSSIVHLIVNFFAGQNIGAKKYERLSKIVRTCLLCAFVAGVITGGLAFLFKEPLLSLYITDSTETVNFGVQRMTYICLTYFICGMMDTMSDMLRGMGKSLHAMIITLMGACGLRIIFRMSLFKLPFFILLIACLQPILYRGFVVLLLCL